MFEDLKAQIKHIKKDDPSAKSTIEILLLYPGVKAIFYHRIAKWFYRHHLFFLARWLSEKVKRKTGIEIHPGATIGKGVFIDHGMGVVIGETAIVGDYVKIFHGVTLGANKPAPGRRHPKIGPCSSIGAGAKVLGGITVGKRAKIGSSSVVLQDVPDDATAVGVPARIIKRPQPGDLCETFNN